MYPPIDKICTWSGCGLKGFRSPVPQPIYRNCKCNLHSSFSIIHHFLPYPGRILPALTSNGLRPLNINAGRILPGFGRKWWIIEKIDCKCSPLGRPLFVCTQTRVRGIHVRNFPHIPFLSQNFLWATCKNKDVFQPRDLFQKSFLYDRIS